MSVTVVKNRDSVITELIKLIKIISDERIQQNELFKIGVSGGSVANFLVEGLLKLETDFTKWRIFFCDERLVPTNNSDSTFGFYKKNLIGIVDLKDEQFITIKQGLTAEETASDYIEQMTKYFEKGSLPCFDLLLLGMGPDGHTCSLFPGHKLLNETNKWVAAIIDSPKPPPERITLTLPVINNAKNCVFAICGKEKADTVKKILVDKEDLPTTKVKPTSGKCYWILDSGAAYYYK